jgi:hypothetical protein
MEKVREIRERRWMNKEERKFEFKGEERGGKWIWNLNFVKSLYAEKRNFMEENSALKKPSKKAYEEVRYLSKTSVLGDFCVLFLHIICIGKCKHCASSKK